MTASKAKSLEKLRALGETSDRWETKQHWQILAQIHKLEDLQKLRNLTGRPFHDWECRPYEDIEAALKVYESGDTRDLSTRLGSAFKR